MLKKLAAALIAALCLSSPALASECVTKQAALASKPADIGEPLMILTGDTLAKFRENYDTLRLDARSTDLREIEIFGRPGDKEWLVFIVRENGCAKVMKTLRVRFLRVLGGPGRDA